MRISIENSIGTGAVIDLEVSPDDDMGSIKDIVCDNQGLDPEQSMLVFKGKQLEDGFTVAECGLTEGDRIALMATGIRGGR